MLWLLILVPVVFNAILLLPELRNPVPNLNDDAFHYLLIQRASAALANGENPFDFWSPVLELGFPQFLFYQHLPHLAVVLLHRLLLQQVGLLTLFNLTRYLLLIGLPLTVYWSMRQMRFSAVAGAVAAAAATLLSSDHRYGFEYDSYVWRGFGMYTQLWAMHLSFIALACLHRVMERGRGYSVAVVALSALVLSHLIYAYITAITAVVLFFVGLNWANGRARLVRLAIVGGLTAVVTSYFWVPFLLFKGYLSVSPYLQSWKYDSFGARDILTWLVKGDLLDYGRFPVLTLLLAVGVVAALVTRTRLARLALALLGIWLLFYFGRPTWGHLADLLPMHEGLLFSRFIGAVDMAAILLIGLGGAWIWVRCAQLPDRWHLAATGLFVLAVLALLVPALRERQAYYALNAQWMERARAALNADGDAATVLSTLKDLPPGRTYAGLRDNWGKQMRWGDLRFSDLLTFNQIAAVSPPYQSVSLNSDLIWHFDDTNPAHYDLFNVRYVVAPNGLSMPAFLRPIKTTPRYILYGVETSGYGQFARSITRQSVSSQSSLFIQNRDWLLGPDPAAGRFIQWDYPADRSGSGGPAASGCPSGGAISYELVAPGRMDFLAECPQAATFIVKATYHPNWRATIDGRQQPTFMVSPSFIGLSVPAGQHRIVVEYVSPPLRGYLLIAGLLALLLIAVAEWYCLKMSLRGLMVRGPHHRLRRAMAIWCSAPLSPPDCFVVLPKKDSSQ